MTNFLVTVAILKSYAHFIIHMLSLENLLGKKSTICTIRVLLERDEEMTGRAISRAAKLSQGACQLSLHHLEKAGFIQKKTIGPSYAYMLINGHPLLEGIKDLFSIERSLRKKGREGSSIEGK